MSFITRQERECRCYRQQKLAYARSLRCSMTSTERKLWKILRGRNFFGIKFRRQVPMEAYIADFLCYERALIVEIDGSVHATRADYDRERDRCFRDCGYAVLRVSNDEVEDGQALQKIYHALAKNKMVPAPLSPRERGWG